jgi:chromosome segregation ATPase
MTRLLTIPWIRRTGTIAVAALALALGFGAIRAASAWTAAAAPLDAAPVSAGTLTERLAAEQSRSAVLLDQLRTLTDQSTELTAALQTAEARIGADADVAATLSADLADAKKRLKALEATIKKAKAALAASAQSGQASTARPASGGEHEDDDHEEDDD